MYKRKHFKLAFRHFPPKAIPHSLIIYTQNYNTVNKDKQNSLFNLVPIHTYYEQSERKGNEMVQQNGPAIVTAADDGTTIPDGEKTDSTKIAKSVPENTTNEYNVRLAVGPAGTAATTRGAQLLNQLQGQALHNRLPQCSNSSNKYVNRSTRQPRLYS